MKLLDQVCRLVFDEAIEVFCLIYSFSGKSSVINLIF